MKTRCRLRHRLIYDSWGRANVQMNKEIRKNSEEVAWAGCAKRHATTSSVHRNIKIKEGNKEGKN